MKYNEYDAEGTLQTTDTLFSMEEANAIWDTNPDCYRVDHAPRVSLYSNTFPFWRAKIMIIDANGNEIGYMQC